MRKALNENPVVQIGLLGVLGLIVAVVFMTRMGGGSSATPEPATTTPPAAGTADASAATPAVQPAAGTPTAAAAVAPSAVPAGTATGAFEAGKGLPADVVSAYKDGDVVILLVVQDKGIEDKPVEREVESLRGIAGTTVFVTDAKHVSKYSRIVQGVQLDRVPAIVALKPLSPKAKGHVAGLPEASVTYGFRGLDSVRQIVDDARYRGNVRGYDPG